MNPELGADGSGFLGLPEEPALLVAGRLQSGPGVAFLGPKCLFASASGRSPPVQVLWGA
jgi:hypothetical protein